MTRLPVQISLQWILLQGIVTQFRQLGDGGEHIITGFGNVRLWSCSAFAPSLFPRHASGTHHHRRRRNHRKDSTIKFDVILTAIDRLKNGIGGVHNTEYSSGSTSPLSPSNNNTMAPSMDNIDFSNISEAQVLLACRAWLLRKHKLEWKEKKRRVEAAASPLYNEGYFWPDPNDLLYLREDPDPYDLNYNETYGEYYGYKRNGVRFLQSTGDTTYSGKNYYDTEPIVEERPSISNNPFSANPLFPSEENRRRSVVKSRLWNNQTWKAEWYNQRWRGKVATQSAKKHEHEERLLRDIPNDILESPLFDSMSESEVSEAILAHINSNHRKSESRKGNKDKRQVEREDFREWREQVKRDALNATDIVRRMKARPASSANENKLSFSPSIDALKKLNKRRSEQSKKAFQTRVANIKPVPSTSVKITKLSRGSEQEVRRDDLDETVVVTSPMQAILHIDMALDHNRLPSPNHVEMILRPGRLGRRRETLRRILSECFDLRGKCVPNPRNISDEDSLLFVTKCGIEELGNYVLLKLKE